MKFEILQQSYTIFKMKSAVWVCDRNHQEDLWIINGNAENKITPGTPTPEKSTIHI